MNGRIAFGVASEPVGEWPSDSWPETYYSIRTVRPDGSDARREIVRASQPAYAPDGRTIAFARTPPSLGGCDIFVQRVGDGENKRRITDPPCADSPSWSPSGSEIAFSRAALSRRGRQIGVDLWIYNAEEERRLTSGSDPAWGRTGLIAFTLPPVMERGGLHVILPDGSGRRRFTRQGSQPDWSPYGKSIVYAVGGDIAVVRTDGSGFRRLTRGPAQDSSPAFSPDGKKVAFIRGRRTVHTMTRTGSRLQRMARARTFLHYQEYLTDLSWQPRGTRPSHALP